MKTRKCPDCRGVGHVLDHYAWFCLPLWLLMPFERNAREGITRAWCRRCRGTGFIRVRL